MGSGEIFHWSIRLRQPQRFFRMLLSFYMTFKKACAKVIIDRPLQRLGCRKDSRKVNNSVHHCRPSKGSARPASPSLLSWKPNY